MTTVIGFCVLCAFLLIKRLYFWQGGAPQRLKSGFILISHRGITYKEKDNSPEAIAAVGKSPCKFVEIDLRLTADGYVIVYHDPVIYDAKGKPHKIENLSLSQLRSISASLNDDNFRIPTLDDALNVLPENVGVILELKTRSLFSFRMERNVMRLLKKHQGKQTVILSSFNPFSIIRIKLLSRSIPTAFVWKDESVPVVFSGILWIRFIHPDILHPNQENVNSRVLRLARRHGLPVHVWTVNDKTIAGQLRNAGVQGIFTDVPDRLDSSAKQEYRV